MRCVAFVVALDVFSMVRQRSFIFSLGKFRFLSILPFIFWILNKSGLHISGFAFTQSKRGRKPRAKIKLQLPIQNKLILKKIILSPNFANVGYSILHKLLSVLCYHCHNGGETCGFPEAQEWYSTARWSRTKPASGKTSGDAAELVSTWKSFCITYHKHRGIIYRWKLMQTWKIINENPKLWSYLTFRFGFLHAQKHLHIIY